MARTTGVKQAVPEAPTIQRSLEYQGYVIARMSNGETWFYEPGQSYYVALDVATAKGEIDAMLKEEEPVPEYTGKGHGGYTLNPPEWCKHRTQFEGEPGIWWADVQICHGTCQTNHHCPTFTEFMAGQKDRIKLMHTERSKEACPHCQAPRDAEYDNGNASYVCGTIYHRLSGEYKQHCKKPEPEQRRRRTT